MNHILSQRLTAVMNPVLAEVLRGNDIESAHRGVAAVVDASGRTRLAWGSADRRIFARSMMKPIQATALVASGAAEHMELSPDILALAASSHFGETQHLTRLMDWAKRIGVSAGQILCGSHKPFNPEAATELLRNNRKPSVFHNNNCGKHLSLLTICRQFGWPVEGYLDFDHPVQAYVRDIIEALTLYRPTRAGNAIDACGAPTEAIPIRNLARGLAQMVAPTTVSAELAAAARAIITAMASYPQLTSGEGRLTSWLMELTNGDLIVKGGSEGGQAAISVKGGVAVVVKIDDGAHRAAEAVFVDTLRAADLLSERQYRKILERYPRQQWTYCRQTVTGYLHTAMTDGIPPDSAHDAMAAVQGTVTAIREGDGLS